MTLSVAQLKQWHLPVNPINYAVSYEYISNNKPILTATIKQQLQSNKNLDGFFMEDIYKQFVLDQSKFRDEIISDLSTLLNSVKNNSVDSSSSAQILIKQLDDNIPELLTDDKKKVRAAVAKLHKASTLFKKQQLRLTEQLKNSQNKAKELEDELLEVRKEVYLDPVTGLHNLKSMSKYIDTWQSKDTNTQVSAIIISVDHFSQFSLQFGALIGDVILSKIAKKIGSYVDDSGLPVRSGHDEFIILIPDIDDGIANEIAEKIKQGIEKLRFVSVQSGVRLPQMNISFGVSEMENKEPINKFMKRTRKTIN